MRGTLWGRNQEEIEEKRRLAQTPANRKLKYSAIGFAAVCICLMLSMIIWFDNLSAEAMLLMRGCAGLAAMVFVILTGIFVYRVNSQYHKSQPRRQIRR